eukprot:Opistho-2@6451
MADATGDGRTDTLPSLSLDRPACNVTVAPAVTAADCVDAPLGVVGSLCAPPPPPPPLTAPAVCVGSAIGECFLGGLPGFLGDAAECPTAGEAVALRATPFATADDAIPNAAGVDVDRAVARLPRSGAAEAESRLDASDVSPSR